MGNNSNADDISWDEFLDEPTFNVVFLRHALAPGYGDPPEFNIDNCKTQRNLNDVGRDQARSIGRDLKMKSVEFDEIYSSEWCRCIETANLMDLGEVITFTGLNSFFEDHYDTDETLRKLAIKLEGLEKTSRVLMVTHQVVISAITGLNVGSGIAVAYSSRNGSAIKIDMQ
tara:strand:- start:747 stop:1259 length:513 start_codon:yes stop_codon:yes gene_type:complete